jgi:hypothetical protein
MKYSVGTKLICKETHFRTQWAKPESFIRSKQYEIFAIQYQEDCLHYVVYDENDVYNGFSESTLKKYFLIEREEKLKRILNDKY